MMKMAKQAGCSMVKVNRIGLMALFMWVTGMKGKCKGREDLYMRMEMCTRENS